MEACNSAWDGINTQGTFVVRILLTFTNTTLFPPANNVTGGGKTGIAQPLMAQVKNGGSQ